MCGIAGAVGGIDKNIVDAIIRVSDAMEHRGPDGQGLWCSEDSFHDVVFAHRRLAIIDLSDDSAQPMIENETGCVISYNGELYNFRSLRDSLIKEGHSFESTGDTEVVLKSYLQWGKDCVSRFEGMFAFAIYDPRIREVFIARDPLGIKPLYYAKIITTSGAKSFIFASELKALLQSDLIHRNLNPEALSSYIWNGFVVEPLTMIEGIHLLEAGHTLTIERSGATHDHCYWETQIFPVEEPFSQSAFEQELEKIVQQHLISDVPIGVFLSGGVDSSFIAALAARNSDCPINTFCVTFTDSKYAESHYAKRVARAIGANHDEFLLTDDYFMDHLDDALESLDQPSFDGINTYYVSRIVAEQNIKVALAGTGGDELFGGYASFTEIPLINQWAKWLNLIPISIRNGLANFTLRILQGSQSLPLQTRWGKLADLLTSQMDTISAYQISYGLFTKKFLAQLSPDYYDVANLGLSTQMLNRLDRVTSDGVVRQGVSGVEENMFLGQRLLRDSDACSMKVSLELRVPLVGKKIFTLASRVPEKFRFFPKQQKQLLRDAVAKDLPYGIFDRPKRGFELPMDTWLKTSMAERGDEVFYDKALLEGIGLNARVVKNLWVAYLAGEKGLYWSRVWSLYVLLWWCKTKSVSLAK